MIDVFVDSNKVSVFKAMLWADYNIGSEFYKFEHNFPDTRWKFTFTNPAHATHFILIWG